MKEEKSFDLFEFSWGKLGASLGVLGLILALFDFDMIVLMFKMFILTCVIPIIGIVAVLMCTWSPTRAVFWAVFDGVIQNFNETAKDLYAKANVETESKDSEEHAA